MRTSLLILILSTIAISNRVACVIFGQQANPGEFRFAASIYEGGFFTCSGAIINKRYILTAGHCICAKKRISLRVIVGVVRVTSADAASWLEVAAIHCYDSFRKLPDAKNYEHDIGLIKLKDPIEVGCNVGPIRLSLDSSSYLRTGCKLVLYRENDKYGISGINSDRSINSMDLSLRWSLVEVPSREECLPWTNRLMVNEICALNAYQTEQRFRPGDSGAPILCGGKIFAILVTTLTRSDIKGAAVLQVAPYLNWMANIVDP